MAVQEVWMDGGEKQNERIRLDHRIRSRLLEVVLPHVDGEKPIHV